jgi:COMPASS component SWD3
MCSRVWNINTGECLHSILPAGNPVPPFTFAEFTPNDNYVLLGTLGGKLQLWDYDGTPGEGPLKHPTAPVVKKTYTGHKNDQYPLQAAFLVNEPAPSTEQYVISGSEDHHIYFWDLNQKTVTGVLHGRPGPDSPGAGHCDVVHAVDTSSREALVASGGGERDGTVKLWRHNGG